MEGAATNLTCWSSQEGNGVVDFNEKPPVFQKIVLPKGRRSPLLLKPLPFGLLLFYAEVMGSWN